MTKITKFNNIDLKHSFNMDINELKLIKNNSKKSIVKSFYLPIEKKEIGVYNIDTNRIEIIVKIGMILDLTNMHPEDLELIFDEANITNEFRKYYPCNYLYTVDSWQPVQ
ncbi:hypothetical protein Kolga_gp32 [Pelagibacter phage Kolga EXVC016S]|nr:hypothetical protein Kolga_gp32 [Pelagibacter phage Kolga EXVC016S]